MFMPYIKNCLANLNISQPQFNRVLSQFLKKMSFLLEIIALCKNLYFLQENFENLFSTLQNNHFHKVLSQYLPFPKFQQGSIGKLYDRTLLLYFPVYIFRFFSQCNKVLSPNRTRFRMFCF